ncbi:TonB-dependent receptor [Dyella jejuensis]|uniref:TonB-dependent receptor n=2 Tax=Dyella jejuensis TaxID=1432009 RepID=A0ABW8JGI3_9GAMM
MRRRICIAVTLSLMGAPCMAAQVQNGNGDPAVSPAEGNSNGAPQPSASASSSPGAKPQAANNSPASTQLSTIVVTANKRTERLQDVTMAVSVLSSTQLERENALGFADYAAQIPGLNTISSGDGWTQLVLRGITSGSMQPNATVGTYIDDTPYGSSTIYAAGSMLTPDIDPSDLERIEVLRGPQGTLYGANTLGGLVKFVTTPPDTTEASARVGFDTNSVEGGGNGYGTHAMVNLPLVANTLGLRINVYDRDDPGYIDNIKTGQTNVNEAKVSGARAQLLWTPSDKVSVRFSTLAQNLSSNGLANSGVDINPSTLQPLYGWQDQSRAAGTGLFKVKYRLYDLSVNADFGWAKLISTTSYGTQRFSENTDLTDIYGPVLNPVFGLSDGGYSEFQNIALNKVTQELRLQSPQDQMWEWRVGMFYTREHTVDTQDILGFDANTGAPLALPALGLVSVGPAIFTEWAGYGDLTWHATSKLSIQAGVRYSNDSTSYSEIGSGLLLGTLDTNGNGSDHPVTYLLNPSYKFTDDLMAYVRIASGYRPGGPNMGVPPDLGAPLTFDPDKLVSYEAGLKALLLDHRMSFDVDGFYIDWSKVQLTTTEDGISFLGNGGKATSAGAEASWRYTPLAGFTVWANASYTNAQLSSNTPTGSIYGLKGDPLPYVPKWSGNIGADYNFPIGGGWSGFVGGDVSYVGTRYSDFNAVPGPRIRLPSYSNVDLHVGANYDNWTFEVYAKNLANERELTSVSSESIIPLASPYSAAYQRPRTIGVSASVDF